MNSGPHAVRRTGFPLTRAFYLSSTAAQGQTLRTGVTIDCARGDSSSRTGTPDDQWWLHLYVMFSRVTRMRNMLLLRPPPREFLERGPPAALKTALDSFARKTAENKEWAERLAPQLGFVLPPS